MVDEVAIEPLAEELVTSLNKFLGHFVEDTNRDEQEMHLRGVVMECAKFGHVILSQPAEHVYNFVAQEAKEIVVCPGLDRTTDDQGLSRDPDAVSAPRTEKLLMVAPDVTVSGKAL